MGYIFLKLFYDFVEFAEWVDVEKVLGENFSNLVFVEAKLGVKIEHQKSGLKIVGELKNNVEMSKAVFNLILNFLQYEYELNFAIIKEILNFVRTRKFKPELFDCRICLNHRKEVVLAKNFGQMFYLNSIRKNVITFGVGPAGTGKTFLAVAQAVEGLKSKLYKKIVFTRPVLEAGESLGFLPGDLQSKVDPFLKPLYDAMCDFVGVDVFNKNMERGFVEVLPLAYMRGRSLNDSFIVLDEAQNTTSSQMKMFLTRLGFNSKMIITGDLTQIDLPRKMESGLFHAIKILKNVKNIGIVKFDRFDVVRNSLVQKILEAYDLEAHGMNN